MIERRIEATEAAMNEAILRQGVLVPLGPLPANWKEGDVFNVASADQSAAEPEVDGDKWAEMMNQLCADSSADDDKLMRQAIELHRQVAKRQVRREMGLSA